MGFATASKAIALPQAAESLHSNSACGNAVTDTPVFWMATNSPMLVKSLLTQSVE
jgi:hypothetical protein